MHNGVDHHRGFVSMGFEDASKHEANQSIADQIYMKLCFHYPGHLWRVEVSLDQGVALIRLMTFTDVPHVIKLNDLKNTRNWSEVKDAGGEFLERFRMPRAGFSHAEFNAAVHRFRPMFNRGRMPPS